MTQHNREDKKFYMPVKIKKQKTAVTLAEKVIQKTKMVQDYKNFH